MEGEKDLNDNFVKSWRVIIIDDIHSKRKMTIDLHMNNFKMEERAEDPDDKFMGKFEFRILMIRKVLERNICMEI